MTRAAGLNTVALYLQTGFCIERNAAHCALVSVSAGSQVFSALSAPAAIRRSSASLCFGIRPELNAAAAVVADPGAAVNKDPVDRPVDPAAVNTAALASSDLPKFSAGSITLEETVIEKTRLKYARSLGKNNMQGHKIDESDANIYRMLPNTLLPKEVLG